MLVELNYVFFSLLLVIYGVWRYFKQRKRHLLYFTLSFAFLALSVIVRMFSSIVLVYGIHSNVTVLRLLELGGLAFFACFTITAVIALREISKT